MASNKRIQRAGGDVEVAVVQIDLLKSCQAAVGRLNALLVPVLKSVRFELNVPLDEDVLLGIMEERHRSQSGQDEDFIREVAIARDKSQPST